MLDRIEERQN